jgi:hypothetical protein
MRQRRNGGRGHLKAFLWTLPLLACAAGCGSPKVSGKVTYKGERLHMGSVEITAANGWVGTSQINEDGTYSIANVPPGTAKIAVDCPSFETPGTSSSPAARKHGVRPPLNPDAAQASSGVTEHPSVKIPDKYKKAQTSGLTVEVTGGRQTHDIDLQ